MQVLIIITTGMGQENEKVIFEGQANSPGKRRHIFDKDAVKPEICEVPGCHCKLQHKQAHAKVCSNCLEVPPPFLKTNYKPKYVAEIHDLQSPQRVQYSSLPFHQPQIADSIPTKIPYFNAWSLPIHRHYIDDKQRPINHQSEQSQRFPAPSIVFVDRGGDSSNVPVLPRQIKTNDKRQNLNMYDY